MPAGSFNPQKNYDWYVSNIKNMLANWDFPGAAQYAVQANSMLAPYGYRIPDDLSDVNSFIAKMTPEEKTQYSKLQEANKLLAAGNTGNNGFRVTKEDIQKNPDISSQQLANNKVISYWSGQSEPYARVMSAINNDPSKLKFSKDEDGNLTLSTGEHPGWDSLTLKPTGTPNVYQFSTYNQVAAGNISGALIADPATGKVAPIVNAATQFAYTPGESGSWVRNTVGGLLGGVKDLFGSLGPLGTLALAYVTGGAGAAIGQAMGLSGASAAIVGNTIVNTALNGGDVGKALTGSLAAYAGAGASGLAGDFAKSGELGSFLQDNPQYASSLANTATRTLMQGGDVEAAIKNATLGIAADAATSNIDGFKSLPVAAQNTIKATIQAELQGKDVNVEGTLKNAAVNGLTSYALNEIPEYKDLDPKYQALVASQLSGALQGKDLTADAVKWAINQGNQEIAKATKPTFESEINKVLDMPATAAPTIETTPEPTPAPEPEDITKQLEQAGLTATPATTETELPGDIVKQLEQAGLTATPEPTPEPTPAPAPEPAPEPTKEDIVKQLEQAGLTAPEPTEEAPPVEAPEYPVQDLGITPENLASYQENLLNMEEEGRLPSQWQPNEDGTQTLVDDDGSTITINEKGEVVHYTEAPVGSLPGETPPAETPSTKPATTPTTAPAAIPVATTPGAAPTTTVVNPPPAQDTGKKLDLSVEDVAYLLQMLSPQNQEQQQEEGASPYADVKVGGPEGLVNYLGELANAPDYLKDIDLSAPEFAGLDYLGDIGEIPKYLGSLAPEAEKQKPTRPATAGGGRGGQGGPTAAELAKYYKTNVSNLSDADVAQMLKGSEGLISTFNPTQEAPSGGNPYSRADILKGILGGTASNIESVARGGLSAIPGAAGDIESLLRGMFGGSKNVLPTSSDIRGMVPRITEPRMETSGMETMGEAMSPLAAKGLTAASGGIKDLMRGSTFEQEMADILARSGKPQEVGQYASNLFDPNRSNLVGTHLVNLSSDPTLPATSQRLISQALDNVLAGNSRAALNLVIDDPVLGPKMAKYLSGRGMTAYETLPGSVLSNKRYLTPGTSGGTYNPATGMWQ